MAYVKLREVSDLVDSVGGGEAGSWAWVQGACFFKNFKVWWKRSTLPRVFSCFGVDIRSASRTKSATPSPTTPCCCHRARRPNSVNGQSLSTQNDLAVYDSSHAHGCQESMVTTSFGRLVARGGGRCTAAGATSSCATGPSLGGW